VTSQNQRTTKRYDVVLDVEMTVGEQRHLHKTRNISLGGIFVETDLHLALGARVQLRFSIPNQKEPIEVGGIVRWSDPGGLGVQFDGLRARDVWSLGKYFEQL
jgi:Tfp pilus assembly protein PilZ